MPTVKDEVAIKNRESPAETKPWERVTQACARQRIKPATRVLLVSIGSSTLQFFRNGQLVKSYLVSTSRRPPSNLKGSLGTPRGLHEIVERIGGGQPIGMVFKGRAPTGQHFSELPPSEQGLAEGHATRNGELVSTPGSGNLITSRILWLGGLEDGVNRGGDCDTRSRYVYIHGTNHESRIGEAFSAGCILMRNLDIIELYEEVRRGDQVLIVDGQ